MCARCCASTMAVGLQFRLPAFPLLRSKTKSNFGLMFLLPFCHLVWDFETDHGHRCIKATTRIDVLAMLYCCCSVFQNRDRNVCSTCVVLCYFKESHFLLFKLTLQALHCISPLVSQKSEHQHLPMDFFLRSVFLT